ncbi:GumC family protein [Vibrio sonorensis]|uniref:GumC family protein n=1 Tax=Vibrio sonorensis TaxID=1004316 RepID=UPI0008DA3133|nr:chain-length determining protein [Vibrio sonorensis]
MNELKLRFITLFCGAWRRRYIIVLPMLLMPIVGFFVGNIAPTTYKAHTSLLIQETAKMNPFLEDLAVSTMLKERLHALRTLLKSRHVLTSVATEQNLISENMSDKEKEAVITRLSHALNITQLGKDFLKIELSARNPNGMKDLLESISHHFIEQLLAPERSSIEHSSEFLQIHITQRKLDLESAENALADYQNRFSGVTPELQAQSLIRLASLKQTLAEKKAELSGVRKSLGSLDQQLSKTNPVIGKLEEQIIDIRSELSLLQARYTDNHSAVQGKKRELRRLEEERATLLSVEQQDISSEQLWDMASSQEFANLSEMTPLLVTQLHNLQLVRAKFESLNEETKSLDKMVKDLEEKALGFGDYSKELLRLQREVTIKRQLYEQLLERNEMAKLTGSLGLFEQNKRVKIIDLPFTPSVPSNIPAWVFTLAGWFAGIALGIGTAIILELLDTSIRRVDELEALSGTSVIALIPRIRLHNFKFTLDIYFRAAL